MVRLTRRPARGNDQLVTAARHFERHRVVDGGKAIRPGPRFAGIDIDAERPSKQAMIAAVVELIRRRLIGLVTHQGGQDLFGQQGLGALEGAQAAVRMGQSAHKPAQAIDMLVQPFRTRQTALAQGIFDQQQIVQEIQTLLRTARHVAAIGQDQAFEDLGQQAHATAAETVADLARQDAPEHDKGHRLVATPGRVVEAAEMTTLFGQAAGQIDGVAGRTLRRQPASEDAQIDQTPRQNFFAPRKRRPAAEGFVPQNKKPQSFFRAVIALAKQRAQPFETVQIDGKGARRAGAVPRVPRALDAHPGTSQGEAPRQDRLTQRLRCRAHIVRCRDEAFRHGARQGQAITGHTEQLGTRLTTQPGGDDVRPRRFDSIQFGNGVTLESLHVTGPSAF